MENRIREDIKRAMKDGDKERKEVLRVVVGEIDRGNNRSDSEYIRVIKKMIKGIEECGGGIEKDILEEYIPKKMSREEIRVYIKEKGIEIDQKVGESRGVGMVIKEMKKENREADHGDIRAIVVEKLRECEE